jgi:hypothetical protein
VLLNHADRARRRRRSDRPCHSPAGRPLVAPVAPENWTARI